jgi:hypothetical protein
MERLLRQANDPNTMDTPSIAAPTIIRMMKREERFERKNANVEPAQKITAPSRNARSDAIRVIVFPEKYPIDRNNPKKAPSETSAIDRIAIAKNTRLKKVCQGKSRWTISFIQNLPIC